MLINKSHVKKRQAPKPSATKCKSKDRKYNLSKDEAALPGQTPPGSSILDGVGTDRFRRWSFTRALTASITDSDHRFRSHAVRLTMILNGRKCLFESAEETGRRWATTAKGRRAIRQRVLLPSSLSNGIRLSLSGPVPKQNTPFDPQPCVSNISAGTFRLYVFDLRP